MLVVSAGCEHRQLACHKTAQEHRRTVCAGAAKKAAERHGAADLQPVLRAQGASVTVVTVSIMKTLNKRL
jgi:hypothetical protein